ncbi:MAG: response regulator [Salibacteraceae bacterium]
MSEKGAHIGKICVIDDDTIYQYLLKRELIETNLAGELIGFSDGAQALAYIHEVMDEPENLPDLILLDIKMPIMNGWEFLEEFIKVRPRLPKEIVVLVISSSIDENDIQRAQEYSEVTDYIIKPVKRDELIETLKRL